MTMDALTRDRLLNETRVRMAAEAPMILGAKLRKLGYDFQRPTFESIEHQALLMEAAERIEHGKGPRDLGVAR